MLILVLGCALLLGIAPSDANTQSVTGEAKSAFLQTWGKHLESMRTLHMVFTQEKHLRFLNRPLSAQGELWLKGDTLRYILQNPDGKTEVELYKDPHTVNIHYPQLRTLEVIDLHTTQALPLAIPFLGRNLAALAHEYETELFVAAGLYTLRLLPKDPKALFSEMRLTLKEFRPQAFTRIENNGDRVTMTISTFTPNAAIREEQLALSIPAGTKVTHPLK